jgi:hypothetical protein
MVAGERSMKPYLVVASINPLINLVDEIEELVKTSTKVIVVDEGDSLVREKNDKILRGVERSYYGPAERRNWFRERFGQFYEKYASIIPEKAHAETSFGFLVALEEGADFIIELDDDVLIKGLIQGHQSNLYENSGETVYSKSKWYNTLDLLVLNSDGRYFPRGHPYAVEARVEDYRWHRQGGRCVLNMGHWLGNPDFDALTILYNGGLEGRCKVIGESIKKEKVIVGKGTYFAVCSMNTSFVAKIIPAFYQLYMNVMGIDRFDDIWSGLFLKRIVDHLGDLVCLGKPAGIHEKRPRSTFNDLKKELEGMIINEWLWKAVDSCDLSGSSYADCYLSLVEALRTEINSMNNEVFKKFMSIQLDKMQLWVETIDAIS